MMHGCGKSGEAIVAVKPANKAERSAAEVVERRAEAKGNGRSARHEPDTALDNRVTGAGMHTSGRWLNPAVRRHT